jgi:hypothetical protein
MFRRVNEWPVSTAEQGVVKVGYVGGFCPARRAEIGHFSYLSRKR